MIERKDWGTVERIFDHPMLKLDKLIIEKGGLSSTHYHLAKMNLFLVVEGSLTVVAGSVPVLLQAGKHFLVLPTVVHRFEAFEHAICLEVSFGLQCLDADIYRISPGGQQCDS